MSSHRCVRVYNSGRRVTLSVAPSDLAEWLAYNQTMRFGVALFVDEVC